ncbi:MAG: hypothetical protein OXT06_17845, partial [Rhodospirillaceae bacterium]|nr:hypothetical protein [Rhodospirillaceae bacterium]MDD9929671.1 hypothetical protein [Rhodospirillaceae bacterium]
PLPVEYTLINCPIFRDHLKRSWRLRLGRKVEEMSLRGAYRSTSRAEDTEKYSHCTGKTDYKEK